MSSPVRAGDRRVAVDEEELIDAVRGGGEQVPPIPKQIAISGVETRDRPPSHRLDLMSDRDTRDGRTPEVVIGNVAGGVRLSPSSAIWAGHVPVHVRRFQPGAQSAIEKMGKRMGRTSDGPCEVRQGGAPSRRTRTRVPGSIRPHNLIIVGRATDMSVNPCLEGRVP